jgi:hypothetical protein
VGALATADRQRRKVRPLGSGLSLSGIALSMVGLPPMDKVHDIDAKRKTVTSAGKDSCRRAKKHGLRLQNFLSIWDLGEADFGEAGTWRSYIQVGCKEVSTFLFSYSKFQGIKFSGASNKVVKKCRN